MRSGEFYVEFSEELHPGSFADSIDLTSSQGTLTGVVFLENSKILKFVPSDSLSGSIEYTVNIRTSLTDLSSKSLAGVFSEAFVYTGKDEFIFEKPDPTEHNASRIGNIILFQGRNFEYETGLYYFRARYYHPELGRFLQNDPMGYHDSMNMYQAFNQNPVNFVDPMGKNYEEMIVTPTGYKKGPGMGVAQYYDLLLKNGVSNEEAIELIEQSPTYSKYCYDGSLVKRIRAFYMDTSYNLLDVAKETTVNSIDEFAFEACKPVLMIGMGHMNNDAGYIAGGTGLLLIEAFGGKMASKLLKPLGKRLGRWALKKALKKAPKLTRKIYNLFKKPLFNKPSLLPLNPEYTELYRAVGANEFYDLMKTKTFNTVASSMEAKQFGLSLTETINFSDSIERIAAIVRIRIPKRFLKMFDLTPVDTFIFKSGTVTVPQGFKLDLLNKLIEKNIKHVSKNEGVKNVSN